MESDEDRRRRDRFHNERDHRQPLAREPYRTEPSRKRPREDERRPIPDRNAPRSTKTDDSSVIQTFKQWIIQQSDDYITPEGAGDGYTNYKHGERKRHVEQFFLDHKEEEWFKEKYHPEDSATQKRVKETFLRDRFNGWKKLYDAGAMKGLVYDLEHQSKVEKVLDALIMLMESCSVQDAINFMNDGQAMKAKEASPVKVAPVAEPAKAGSEDGEEGEEKADPPAKDPEDGSQEDGELMDTKKPAVYKSVFIKSLPATITKSDIISVCKRYAGFVRVAFEIIADDRRFCRRCWITFDDTVNIKDICWNLNNLRLKETELGAVVHKESGTNIRIRAIPGITNHASIAFKDLKLLVQVAELKDKGLFDYDAKAKATFDAENDDEPEKSTPPVFWPGNVNPLVTAAKKFIADYEDMYEDKIKEIENYQPGTVEKKQRKNEDGETVLDDEDLIEIDLIDDIFAVLDPLLNYVRCIHSVDFYAQADYSQFEDEHPVRCGVCHVRGVIPSRGNSMQNTKNYMLKFQAQVDKNLLRDKTEKITMEEAKEMGLKNTDDEIEKFIKHNTQHLDADKYLCPLSGKKFRGQEYVRKHIFNKHAEKLDVVRADVEYFNTYVMDKWKDGPPEPRFSIGSINTNRPGVPTPRTDDRRGIRQASPERRPYDNRNGGSRVSSSYQSRESYMQRNTTYDRRPPQQNGSVLTRTARDQITNASGGRDVIDYRDLDAPNDMDMFG